MFNRTLQIYLIRVPFGYLLDVWTVYDGERNKVWPQLAHFAIRFYMYYDHLQHLYKTSPDICNSVPLYHRFLPRDRRPVPELDQETHGI